MTNWLTIREWILASGVQWADIDVDGVEEAVGDILAHMLETVEHLRYTVTRRVDGVVQWDEAALLAALHVLAIHGPIMPVSASKTLH